MGWRGLGRLERRRWLRVHRPLSGVTGNTVMLLAVAWRREASHPHFVVQAVPLDAL